MNTRTCSTRSRLLAGAAFAAACIAASATAQADDAKPVAAPTTSADAKPADKQPELTFAVGNTLFAGDPESGIYDDVQQFKKEYDLPVTVGAWHWWHMNRNSPHDLHYGTPSLGGTYFWYVVADPQTAATDDGVQVGAHIDARFRDGDERFRTFFDSRAWLWESYLWAKFCDGTTVKGGKIWRRFGLDWDGSWYGNVAYFDGWKLDPDWGASVEKTCNFGHGITADNFLQVFVAQDRVNGSEAGADAESNPHGHERTSFIARTVPTIKLDDGSTLALGLSAQTGRIDNSNSSDHTASAGAVDLTWTKGPYKVFGEYLASNGVRNPANYVTGGPSSHSTDIEVGAAYTWRFITFRGSVSHGDYDNPGGSQIFYLGGVTVAVTKNVDFYVEYVRWDTKATHGPRSVYEDGINFVINWRF